MIILRRLLGGLAVLFVITVAIAWLSGGFETKISTDTRTQPVDELVSDVSKIEVQKIVKPSIEWTSGTIQSRRHTAIASRLLARIESVNVSAGDEVAEGDVLILLDSRDLEAKLKQAKNEFEAAEAQRELAQSNLNRVAELLERGVSAQQTYDQSFANLRVAQAETNRLSQRVEEARTGLSFTRILAPAAGKVVDRFIEPGDTVSPGETILRIYDPKALRVEVPVRESLAVQLTLGTTLEISIPALDSTLRGPIEQIVPFAEPGARTLLVKVGLPQNENLFAGMFARVAIPTGKQEKLLIPQSTIHQIGQLQFVSVIEDKKITKRLITTGELVGDGQVEILSGLKAGEQVVSQIAK